MRLMSLHRRRGLVYCRSLKFTGKGDIADLIPELMKVNAQPVYGLQDAR